MILDNKFKSKMLTKNKEVIALKQYYLKDSTDVFWLFI